LRGSRSTRGARAVAVAAALASLIAASQAAAGDRLTSLRSRNAELGTETRAALLDLFALDSQLDRASRSLTAFRTSLARLDAERADASSELAAARRTLGAAELRLGQQLRALYVDGEPDPLAVLLGSTSLDEMITAFDGLSRSAQATAAVVREARDARARVSNLERGLVARQARLRQLTAEAAAREATLAETRAERAGLVERLRSEQQLNADAIGRLEARARAAEAGARLATIRVQTAASVQSFRAQAPLRDAPPPPPVGAPTGQRLSDAPRGRTLVVVSTGYDLPGTTATGLPVGQGIAAVDPTVIPLGTRLSIPGYGDAVAADTGPAIRGNRIDLWFPTRNLALGWGWRTLTITLH
jgi:peptidoglycan DL-endopeptidase CwlO